MYLPLLAQFSLCQLSFTGSLEVDRGYRQSQLLSNVHLQESGVHLRKLHCVGCGITQCSIVFGKGRIKEALQQTKAGAKQSRAVEMLKN